MTHSQKVRSQGNLLLAGQEGVLMTPQEQGQSEFGALHAEQCTNRGRPSDPETHLPSKDTLVQDHAEFFWEIKCNLTK